MKKYILLLLLFQTSLNLLSQTNFNNYETIKSSSKIPQEFLKSDFDRYLQLKAQYSNNTFFNNIESRNKFLLLNTQALNILYNSGFVIFNDPISNYAEKILDLILKNNPELRSKINIYTIKTTSASAFSSSDGNIFISIGLMAQLQNEAQLAYIISHEIVHITKEHHAQNFVSLENILINKKRYTLNESTLNALFSYQKENEFEADKLALTEFYKNTNYDISEIGNLFDVLLYSYLPIDETKFELTVFESEHYKFPTDYRLTNYNEITAIEDYNDSKSMHPNILKRRLKIIELTKNENNTGEKYLISETEFKNVRKIARFELSNLYRINKDFEQAIYNSYLLLKKYPENKYLQTNIAESLYGIAYYKNKGNFHKIHTASEQIEGALQQVNFLTEKLTKQEMNICALRYAWNLKQKFKDDAFLKQLTDSLILETAKNTETPLLNFPLSADIQEKEVPDFSTMTKIEKIKYKKAQQTNEKDSAQYYYLWLVDLPENAQIFDRYKALNLNSQNPAKTDIPVLFDDPEDGKALGLDTLISLNPTFNLPVDNFSDEGIEKYFLRKNQFKNDLTKIAEIVDLKIENLSENIHETDIDRINDISALMMWIYETADLNDQNYISSTMKIADELSSKYGSSYFTRTELNYTDFGYYYNYYVYDFKHSKLVFHEYSKIKKVRPDIVKSNLYYSLKQTKRKHQ